MRNFNPTLVLPFDKGILNAKVTCVRAGTATAIDKNGNVVNMTSNTPRINHDLDGPCRGILIEGQSTNYVKNSNNTNGWNAEGATFDVAINIPCPRGSAHGTQYDNIVGDLSVYEDLMIAVNGWVTFSFIARGIISGDGGFSAGFRDEPVSTTLNLTTEWKEYQVTFERMGQTATTPEFIIPGATVSRFEVCCLQVENLPFATSFISTAGASVTRNADIVKMALPSGSYWFYKMRGTFICDFDILGKHNADLQTLLSLTHGASGNEWFALQVDGPNNSFIHTYDDGVKVAINTGITFTPNEKITIGHRNAVDETIAVILQTTFLNGVALPNTTDANPSDIAVSPDDYIYLGSYNVGAALPLYGHIRKLNFYPAQLSDSELEAS